MVGVILVFSDQTKLKKLEMQVRRTDRLASLGTLSAGMAHEIKNPLVTIKTFTQLLPERYQDEDFRDTFSSLLSHEVDRIDRIVNQLLNFARPAKPTLCPISLHGILDHCMRLIHEQLRQKHIFLEETLDADFDMINGDQDQLEQIIINFFLNAIDAMEGGGKLLVNTKNRIEANG